MGGDARLEASLDDNLGLTRLQEGSSRRSRPSPTRRLALRERPRPESPDTVHHPHTLGTSIAEGHDSGAVKYHERARALSRGAGAVDPKVAQATKNVGKNLLHGPRASRTRLSGSIKRRWASTARPGADHPDTAHARELRRVYRSAAIRRCARRICDKFSPPTKNGWAPTRRDAAQPQHISVAFRASTRAHASVRRCAARSRLRRRVYGPVHPEVENALVIRRHPLSQKQFDGASPAYRRAVASARGGRPDRPHTAKIWAALGFVLPSRRTIPRRRLPVWAGVENRDKGEADPSNLAQERFALARALWEREARSPSSAMAQAARKCWIKWRAQAPDVQGEIDDWPLNARPYWRRRRSASSMDSIRGRRASSRFVTKDLVHDFFALAGAWARACGGVGSPRDQPAPLIEFRPRVGFRCAKARARSAPAMDAAEVEARINNVLSILGLRARAVGESAALRERPRAGGCRRR